MQMKFEEPPPKVQFDKAELRDRLTPIEYQITQQKGTERPYSNKFYKHNEKGIYKCLICSEPLFDSSTKYDSGSGWPSFYDLIDKDKVNTKQDASGIGGNLLLIIANPGLIRTEISCRNCGSHLGHVFKDGPRPTGLRYCVNSASLSFEPVINEKDGSVEVENEVMISHPATLGGCDGSSSNLCSLSKKQKAVTVIRKSSPIPPKNKSGHASSSSSSSATAAAARKKERSPFSPAKEAFFKESTPPNNNATFMKIATETQSVR